MFPCMLNMQKGGARVGVARGAWLGPPHKQAFLGIACIIIIIIALLFLLGGPYAAFI